MAGFADGTLFINSAYKRRRRWAGRAFTPPPPIREMVFLAIIVQIRAFVNFSSTHFRTKMTFLLLSKLTELYASASRYCDPSCLLVRSLVSSLRSY